MGGRNIIIRALGGGLVGYLLYQAGIWKTAEHISDNYMTDPFPCNKDPLEPHLSSFAKNWMINHNEDIFANQRCTSIFEKADVFCETDNDDKIITFYEENSSNNKIAEIKHEDLRNVAFHYGEHTKKYTKFSDELKRTSNEIKSLVFREEYEAYPKFNKDFINTGCQRSLSQNFAKEQHTGETQSSYNHKKNLQNKRSKSVPQN